jgi:hypothetical protein
MVDPSFVERNAAARERLRACLGRLDGVDLQRPLGNGWTVTAALAHLTFWERCHLHRLERWAQDGVPPPSLDVDAVNEAALPQWAVMPAHDVTKQLMPAMERMDGRIAALPPQLVETVIADGRTFFLDRSRHRTAHLAEIEAALSADAPR